MKKIRASLLALLPIVLAFFVHPSFKGYESLPLATAEWTFAMSAFYFIIIVLSASGVFITVFNNKFPRILLNFIFSCAIITYLLPMAFGYLNAGIFNVQHKGNTGYTGSSFIKSTVVCGSPVTHGFVIEGGRLVEQPNSTPSVATKNVGVLCPITHSASSLFYKTDTALMATVVMKESG